MDDKYHIGYFGIYPISHEIDLNFKINCNPLCAAADLKFQDADKDQNLIFVFLEKKNPQNHNSYGLCRTFSRNIILVKFLVIPVIGWRQRANNSIQG